MMRIDPSKPTWVVRSVSGMNNNDVIYDDESQAVVDMRALQDGNPSDTFILYESISHTVTNNTFSVESYGGGNGRGKD
jgi:hypothetical protein